MKRLPLLGLGLVLALASCGTSIDSTDQALACYDTGNGLKCVPLADLPAGATAECIDTDGVTDASASSASGPSASDNDTSASSDSPTLLPPTADGDDGDGDDSDSTGDASGASTSSEEDCGGGDTDSDGTNDSQDCDCLDPDSPVNPTPPGGGDGGPVIL